MAREEERHLELQRQQRETIEDEEEALREWEWHFKMKYERLGALIVDDGSAGGDADGGAVAEAAPAPRC